MGPSVGWHQKRALVTGASGFIGGYLITRLSALGAHVYASESPPDGLTRSEPDGEQAVSRLTFDVRNTRAVREAVRNINPHVVFHLAAVGVTNRDIEPWSALMVNVGGVVNLLEALRGSNVERVILTGTSYEYGACGATKELDPFNAYSASKVAAWAFGHMYWRAHQVPVVTVRPFQVYGPGQPGRTLVPSAIHAALSGEDFPMTPGEQMRDFVFAEDVAGGMITIAETEGIEGERLDLGTGIGTPIRRVVEHIWSLAGAEGSMQPGALPYRSSAAMHLVADAERTSQLSGWRATTPLVEGLKATMVHVRSQMRETV